MCLTSQQLSLKDNNGFMDYIVSGSSHFQLICWW